MKRRAVKKASAKRSVARKLPAKRKPIKRKVAKAPARPAPIPPGFHSVSAHLVLNNAAAAIEFYKKAFGAVEVMRMPGPDGHGVAHAELKIGDSIFMLADEWPGSGMVSPAKVGSTSVGLHLYVGDCDAFFGQAVAAGAEVAMPLMNMFWGDRFGKVKDPFGHSWAIATHIEDVSPEECARRGVEAMKQMGPPPEPPPSA